MKELQLEKLDEQATRYLNDISNGDYLYLIRDKEAYSRLFSQLGILQA